MKKYLFVLFSGLIITGSAGAYQEIRVTAGGSVSGTVFYNGAIPAPLVRPVKKHPKECGKGDRIFQEVVVTKGRLSNVVVYLSDIENGKPYPLPGNGFFIKQEGCYFTPHLQVVRQKSKLNVISKDSVGHNIHAYEVDGDRMRTIFNVAQPFSDILLEERVRVRRSNYVKIECDIHDFMAAWLFVAKNPYFAVVNKDGTFEISNIPAGKYTLKAWNPLLGEMERDIKVYPKEDVSADFTFQKK